MNPLIVYFDMDTPGIVEQLSGMARTVQKQGGNLKKI